MPIALIKCVREVSSEDSVQVAANLLCPEISKKWITKSVGEKSAHVILEFDEPYKITGIDIGNEHSAFVEVFVGKTGNCYDDFSEILITCSFMTPLESKYSSNTNRVRCFGQDALVKSKLNTKWQLIKFFCTQPFNKHVRFGLSFITVHVSENETKSNIGKRTSDSEKYKLSGLTLQNQCEEKEKNVKLGLGKFSLREDSPDSDSESVSSLFSRWKTSRERKGDGYLSIPSAIRDASSLYSTLKQEFKKPPTISQREHSSTENNVTRNRNSVELLFGNEDHSNKLPKSNQLTRILNQQSKKYCKSRQQGEELSCNKDINMQLEKLCSTSGKDKKNIKLRPFNRLLEGVVLVISGIQNPSRADLRIKALAMGAKYKGDWESGCTHLICAFKNTPKYNQVRAKGGKIVTSKWIERCYTAKKYLPWRRFALDTEEFDKPESDEEIFNESEGHLSFAESCGTNNKLFKGDKGSKLQTDVMDSSSESDTDDDIKRTVSTNRQRNISKQKPKSSPHKDEVTKKRESIYEVLTEEEDFLKDKYMRHS